MSCRTERPSQKELRKKRKEAQIREKKEERHCFTRRMRQLSERGKLVLQEGRKKGQKETESGEEGPFTPIYFALRHHNVRCALNSLSQSPHHSHNHHLLLWESPAPPFTSTRDNDDALSKSCFRSSVGRSVHSGFRSCEKHI